MISETTRKRSKYSSSGSSSSARLRTKAMRASSGQAAARVYTAAPNAAKLATVFSSMRFQATDAVPAHFRHIERAIFAPLADGKKLFFTVNLFKDGKNFGPRFTVTSLPDGGPNDRLLYSGQSKHAFSIEDKATVSQMIYNKFKQTIQHFCCENLKLVIVHAILKDGKRKSELIYKADLQLAPNRKYTTKNLNITMLPSVPRDSPEYRRKRRFLLGIVKDVYETAYNSMA